MKGIFVLLTTVLDHDGCNVAPVMGLAEADYQAIALARKIANAQNGVEVVAVYAGVGNGGLKLRRALAAGADRAMCLEFAVDEVVDSLYVCKVLWTRLRAENIMLVLAAEISPLVAVVVNPLQLAGMLGWRVARAISPVEKVEFGSFEEPRVIILRTATYPVAELLAFYKPAPIALVEAARKEIDFFRSDSQTIERSVACCGVEAEMRAPCRFFSTASELIAELVTHCPVTRGV
ncbi:MAG: hypothetical protein PHC51_00860 [bacterium]|nr:hypothetical protein [bacterium]